MFNKMAMKTLIQMMNANQIISFRKIPNKNRDSLAYMKMHRYKDRN